MKLISSIIDKQILKRRYFEIMINAIRHHIRLQNNDNQQHLMKTPASVDRFRNIGNSIRMKLYIQVDPVDPFQISKCIDTTV